MTADLYWLTLTALLTAVMAVPYVTERILRRGSRATVSRAASLLHVKAIVALIPWDCGLHHLAGV